MGGSSPKANIEPTAVPDVPEKEDVSIDIKKDHDNGKPPEKEKQISPMNAYFKLWSFATPLDVLLRCLAALASAGSGTAEPLMAIVFGNLVNLFNGTEPITPAEFRSEINKNSLWFVYLFIGKFAVSPPMC